MSKGIWAWGLEMVEQNRQIADGKVKPWQKELKGGDFFVQVYVPLELTIYGEIIELEYKEDRMLYKQPHMKYFRLTRSYSQACPDGEVGDKHVSVISAKITKEQFEEARSRGWPSFGEWINKPSELN